MAGAAMLHSSDLGGGTRERDKSIDILKGIAMILIVAGHAYTPHRDWIYLFHVAVFFIASGYCWNKEITTGNEWRKYVIRKVRELYIPYIAYNSVFVLLNNLFVRMSIYSNNPEFISATLNNNGMYPQRLSTVLNAKDIIALLLRTITLKYRPQVGGATWFVAVLLAILIIHATFEYSISKLFKQQKRNVYIFAVAMLMLVMLLIPQFAVTRKIFLHWIFSRVPYPYAAFLLGILLKKADKWRWIHQYYNLIACIAGFLLLCILYVRGNKVELSSGEVSSALAFMAASAVGWFMLRSLAQVLLRFEKIGNGFAYIGFHTIPILYLHLLAFKVVSSLYVLLNREPRYVIASFPVIFTSGIGYRLMYIAIGVTLPLALQRLVSICVGYIKNRHNHIIRLRQ